MGHRRRARLLGVGAALAVIVVSCAGGAEVTERAIDEADATTGTGSNPLDDRLQVILDGDFGPDDMMALLYLLAVPEVEILAVTVSGTGLAHCPEGADNATAILSHLGHDEIPVGCGQPNPMAGSNAFPEEWRDGADALAESLGVAMVPGATEGRAVDLLIETIEGSDRPVHLLVLGPMTNIAAAIGARPRVVDNLARVVAMGGALEVGGSVAPAYQAEWNLWVDPVAVNTVLATGVPVELVPLDATNDVPATIFFFEALELDRHTPAADLLYKYFARNTYNLEGGSYFFWDPLAAMSMVKPEVITAELRDVTVVEQPGDEIGALVEQPDGEEARIALSADRAAFEETFLSTINGGEDVTVEIPTRDVSVRYDGETCTFDGPTEFDGVGPQVRVNVELVNETETPVSVAGSLHEGVTWDRVKSDATRYQQTGERPPYWQQTGLVFLYGESITGGRTVGPLDLAPGAHALVCGSEEGQIFPLTDLVITDQAG